MNILLQMKKFSGGPSVFRKRLDTALKKIDGVKVVNSDKEPFDVELSFIRILSKHRKPRVLRVDGCYYRPGQVRANNELRKAIKESKIVIFQSNFSKTMVRKILGVKPVSTIIYNGIDLDYVRRVPKDSTIKPESFVAVAGWRPNKRPHSTIQGFLEANTTGHLYMIGDHSKIDKRFKKEPRIHFLGDCSEAKTLAVMKSCKYMLHLCHIDSCPNAVVEGLASGCNVLCTNLGGTKELVKDDGIILDIDNWDFKPNPFKRVDKVNPRIIAQGIQDLLNLKTIPDRPELDISNVAQQYVDVMERVL